MAEPENSNAGNSDGSSSDTDIIRLGSDEGGNRGNKDFIDPAAATGGTGSGDSGVAEPRRRGRKPGTKNKPRAEKTGKIDLGPFSSCILGIHSMLASISRTPELELDAEESEKLAKASANVMRHYVDLDVSQKAADWTNLFMAIGGIYGPRMFAHKIRKARERDAKRQPRGETINQPPQAEVKTTPGAGSNVVHMPVINTGGFDVPGMGGGPGVG